MNIIAILLIVGCIFFAVVEVVGFIRDIKKRKELKKAKEQNAETVKSSSDNNTIKEK